MTLIEGWKHKFPRLWSVRLALLAALFSAIEVGIGWLGAGKPAVFAVVAGVVSLGAAVARIVAQPELK